MVISFQDMRDNFLNFIHPTMFKVFCLGKVLKQSEVPKCLSKGGRIMGRPSKYATARKHTKLANAPKTKAQEKAAEVRKES